MPLITVFFPKETDPGYRKAIIDAKEKKFFIKLGAVETVNELAKVATVDITSNSVKEESKTDGKSGSK